MNFGAYMNRILEGGGFRLPPLRRNTAAIVGPPLGDTVQGRQGPHMLLRMDGAPGEMGTLRWPHPQREGRLLLTCGDVVADAFH